MILRSSGKGHVYPTSYVPYLFDYQSKKKTVPFIVSYVESLDRLGVDAVDRIVAEGLPLLVEQMLQDSTFNKIQETHRQFSVQILEQAMVQPRHHQLGEVEEEEPYVPELAEEGQFAVQFSVLDQLLLLQNQVQLLQTLLKVPTKSLPPKNLPFKKSKKPTL
ncbi:Protein CBG06513 [Caenorhabditis briggsae]|uniref:Protein CBG06513 n=1 Tax=Caenorhabditis briggsae TaxID=6238 RepID=A8X2E6_CAEBR|nr:Protein CBG06513 [Caenorhabditis briggsae]CAP26806.1 Protein CBG06513 [Caenorhabditis briggsae]